MYEVALSAGVVVSTMMRQRELAIGLSVLLFLLLLQKQTSCDRPKNVAAGKASLYQPKYNTEEEVVPSHPPSNRNEEENREGDEGEKLGEMGPREQMDPSLKSTPNPRYEYALSRPASLSDHMPSAVEKRRDEYLFRPEPLQPTHEQRARQLDLAYEELEARSVFRDPWLMREEEGETIRGRGRHTLSALLG